jgi:uncharacterized protein YdhG (YjbR/CyaY superfamily)
MAKTDFKSVGDYIASRPLGARLILSRVRNVIRQALPGAEEAVSNGMPAYKVGDGAVVFFAGGKDHFSIDPTSEKVIATLKKRLARYTISRGTIQFPFSQTMPVDLIASIAKLRAKEYAEQKKASEASKIDPKEAGTKKASPKKKTVANKPAKKASKKAAEKAAAKATKKPARRSSSKAKRTGKKS